jgi:hypothetical protein
MKHHTTRKRLDDVRLKGEELDILTLLRTLL